MSIGNFLKYGLSVEKQEEKGIQERVKLPKRTNGENDRDTKRIGTQGKKQKKKDARYGKADHQGEKKITAADDKRNPCIRKDHRAEKKAEMLLKTVVFAAFLSEKENTQTQAEQKIFRVPKKYDNEKRRISYGDIIVDRMAVCSGKSDDNSA